MKTLSLISLAAFSASMLSLPSRADEPQAAKITPQIQALLQQLLKTAELEPTDEDATPTAPAAPSAPSASSTGSSAGQKPKPGGLMSTALSTGSLRTGSLMTSGSIGGRGRLDAAPRMTNDEWRQLFPVRR